MTSKDICLPFIILFLCLFPFCLDFVSSSPPFSLFNWPRARLHLKVPNHMYVSKRYITYCLMYFWFIECLYIHLFWQVSGGNSEKNNLESRQSKQKKLRLRESAVELTLSPRVWGSWVSTSPLVYSLKRPINYCCRICTTLCMTFKKCLFMEALWDHYLQNMRIVNHYSHFNIMHNE